ncbi:MAG TPA: FAD-dependent oxidoreductase [Candidatus Methanomethylicus sp.]|nr:FAD-dependent oxidoreductase [Candidatus Methanomethylicus sp.]
MEVYDVIVIGGGPAGVTAAVFARRKLLKTLLISKNVGGQVLLTDNIENYTGYEGRTGTGLADIFERQLQSVSSEVVSDVATEVVKDGDAFRVRCEEGEYHGRTVIATGGSNAKMLGVPGEERYFGSGVCVCATCDAPMTRNKDVAVVGGGNAAFQSAELLARFAKKVYVVHRRGAFRADAILVERLRKTPNVEFLLGKTVLEIRGSAKVESLRVRDSASGGETEIQVQKVFVEIGREVKLDYIKGLVKMNERGQAIVDRLQRTSCKGLFAAGDITDLPYGQAIIASGQGAVAGLAAYDYIMGNACRV